MSATIELLKKGTKAATLAQEIASPPAGIQGAEAAGSAGAPLAMAGDDPATDTLAANISRVSTMTARAMDNFITGLNGFTAPENWKKFKVEEKRQHILAFLTGEHAPPSPAAPAPVPVSAPAVAPAVAPASTGALVTSAALTGEVIEADPISNTAQALETLTAEQVPHLIRAILEQQSFDEFRLGGVLALVQAKGWFGGYATLRDYVQAEYGIKYRKAVYLIAIYNGLVNSGIPWEKVQGVGWTKLKDLVPILTPDNVDEWAQLARESTTLQIQAQIAAMQDTAPAKADQATGSADGSPGKVTTLTFKLLTQQKESVRSALERAKAETGNSNDTAALEHIALLYLKGGAAAAPADAIGPLMTELGWERVLEEFEQRFPYLNLTVEES